MKNTQTTLICQVCGQPFKLKRYRAAIAKYCSKACWARRNPPRAKTCPICDQSFQTRHHNQITCSRACAGKRRSKIYIGPKSPHWKGGTSLKNERARNGYILREWREKVYKCDNYTCQQCGYKGRDLHAHHIKPFADFPELRFDITNGITICASCHGKEHDKDFTNRRKKICQECGRPTTGRSLYCHSCAAIFAHERLGHSRQRACPQCHQSFKAHRTDQKYCSPDCVKAAATTSVTVKCTGCRKALKRTPCFIARNKTGTWWCSNACRGKHTNSHIECVCPVCGKSFTVKAYRVKDMQIVTCSPTCRYKHISSRRSRLALD